MSRAALDYGAALGIGTWPSLARRLYDYGRYPVTPRLRRAFPTPDSAADHLLHGDEPLRRALTRGWRRRRFSGEDSGWALWTRPRGDPRRGHATHKLYVSPVLADLRPAFRAVIPVVTDSEALGFKVGAELPYLVRTDKLVLYFADRTEMDRVAVLLAAQLDGLVPHGVPFTCRHGTDELLSWGMDPPGTTDESWRSWLAGQLARAMIDAPVPGERVGAALRRAAALGIDPDSWEPRAVDWERDGPR